MQDYLGEVRIFAGNFAPSNWAFCHGQIFDVNSNRELFSLIGHHFGGDGRTNFALPDLRGRVAIGMGQSFAYEGKTFRIGERGGQEFVTLAEDQMPSHNHDVENDLEASVGLLALNDAANTNTPEGNYYAIHEDDKNMYDTSSEGQMGQMDVDIQGSLEVENVGGKGHYNVQPVLPLNYIICIQGSYPTRK